MNKRTVQNNESSSVDFKRDIVAFRPLSKVILDLGQGGVEENGRIGIVWISDEARGNRRSVATRNGPETAVMNGGRLKSKPKAMTTQRFGVNESAILMRINLTTNKRLFENIYNFLNIEKID